MTSADLTLVTAPECHLCVHAREVLDALGADLGITWREVSTASEEGERLAAAASPLRPALFDRDGRPLAAGRLSEKRLRRDLPRLLPDLIAGAGRG
jgi:hypothetical protein